MSCYFLESTAFAKLFVQEPGTDALIRLMESVEGYHAETITRPVKLATYEELRAEAR